MMSVFFLTTGGAMVVGCLYIFFQVCPFSTRLRRRNFDRLAIRELDCFMAGRKKKKDPVRILKSGQICTPRPAPKLVWTHDTVARFYTRHVIPRIEILKAMNLLGTVKTILGILDKHGDCPSVADHGHIERKRWGERYRLLAEISLREHSLNVATALMEVKEKDDPEFVALTGRVLVAGLGHDLGKIPLFRGKAKDHPTASRNILADILPADHPSRHEILQAVSNHHFARKAANPITVRLKLADQKARARELERLRAIPTGAHAADSTPSGKDPETVACRSMDVSWIKVDELLAAVGAGINVVEAKGAYTAFSCPSSGLVYVQVEALFQTVVALAMRKGHPEVMAWGGSWECKNRLLRRVRTLLGKAISDQVGKEFIGQKYRIVTTDGKKLNSGYYVPIKITAFKTPAWEIESRKKGPSYTHRILQRIKYVEVAR